MSSLAAANQLKVSEVQTIIKGLHAHGKIGEISVYLSGPPGIGKTALYEQMAKELDADYEVFLTATMDPTDVSGIPNANGVLTTFLPPERLVNLTGYNKNGKFTIATFEDLPACNEQVFAALFRLFHEREVGGYKIRDNVLMCATGNRSGDRAGAQELPTALANRFVHYELGVDSDEWCRWAMLNSIDPIVIAFISQTGGKQYLHNFNPDSGETCFPSPRSVAKASMLYKIFGDQPNLLMASLAGCCGENWASTFINFAQVKEKLIPVKDIFNDPDNARLPNSKEIDVCLAVISTILCALAENPKDFTNFSAAYKYAIRLPHRDLGIRLAHNTSVILQELDEFCAFFSCPIGKETLIKSQAVFGKYLNLD